MSSFSPIVVKACLSDQECRDKVVKILRSHKDATTRPAEIRAVCLQQIRLSQGLMNNFQRSILESIIQETHWGKLADELARHFAASDSSIQPPDTPLQAGTEPANRASGSKAILL